MGIDDRDYMKGKHSGKVNKDYLYRPKEFRGARRPAEFSKNVNYTVCYRSILMWIVIALVFFAIFKNLESKKSNGSAPTGILRSTPAMLQFPESGSTIQYQKITSPTGKLIVLSEPGKSENCVVKLETWDSGIPVIELFVRAGERGETQLVPLGKYRVKMACGEKWYGRSELFGRGNRVSIGATPLQFWQSGNTINGQTLTLTKRIDGNFRLTDSYYEQF